VSGGGLGCKFEIISYGGGLAQMGSRLLLVESFFNAPKGGKFLIDSSHGNLDTLISKSPASTPRSNGDFIFNMWPYQSYCGFVMSSISQGEIKCSKPMVQLAMRHVTCMEDVVVFVALSATMDLSMDACHY